MPRAQIKDEKTYQKLREQGASKKKSARIANAAAATSRSKVGRKGGKSRSRRKLAALRISLKAARAARWPTKGAK